MKVYLLKTNKYGATRPLKHEANGSVCPKERNVSSRRSALLICMRMLSREWY